MTIEIDDAGTGDLLGSAWILIWRRETNNLVVKEIPLEIYQSEEFDSLTKQKCKDLIVEAIDEMDIPKTEKIYICTGAIFDRTREYFRDEGYNFQDAKIEGYLQDMVENTYLNNIHMEYGIPKEILSVKSGKERFFIQFNWISEDFPRRKEYVKNGFSKWASKWEEKAKEKWMLNMVQIPSKNANFNNRSYPDGGYSRNTRKRTGDKYRKRGNSKNRGNLKSNSKNRKSRRSGTRSNNRRQSGRKASGRPNRTDYSSTGQIDPKQRNQSRKNYLY